MEFSVYVDGSAVIGKDGKKYAGAGIYFGVDDHRNSAVPILESNATHQLAELVGLFCALSYCRLVKNLVIYSDSKYAIDCVTVWHRSWELNSWKTSKGEPVLYQETIKLCLGIIAKRTESGLATRIEHVYGHKGIEGNEAADKLAKLASHAVLDAAGSYTVNLVGVRTDDGTNWLLVPDAFLFYSTHATEAFLSNFYCSPVTINNKVYSSVEHFYQAAKFVGADDGVVAEITAQKTPAMARAMGRKYPLSGERLRMWEGGFKVTVMKHAIDAKFELGTQLALDLIATAPRTLVENAPTDNYWGCGKEGTGVNMLGKLLMKRRAELIKLSAQKG